MAKIHAMLDLETLGQSSNAFIVQICITTFSLDDPTYSRKSWSTNIDVWRLQVGSESDQSTIQWWQSQDRDVRSRVMGGLQTLPNALTELMEWVLAQGKIDYLWANSPSFDCVILDNACKRNHIDNKLPKFWAWRDMRTVVALANDMGAELPKLRNTHDAEQDVINQISLVEKAIDFINQKG